MTRRAAARPATLPELHAHWKLKAGRSAPRFSRVQHREIRFELPIATPVRLEVFDLQGRRIATLAEASFPAGFHTVSWDRRDATGVRVKPGIYLYRLEAGAFRDQKKMSIFP